MNLCISHYVMAWAVDTIGFTLSLKANRVKCTRYIGVEINPTSRIICDNANPTDGLFPGVDHSWSIDVFKITEEMIRDLSRNAIKSFAAGPPCEDMSKLRLLPGYRKIKGEPRPGLKGKQGQVFVQTLQVFTWVLKYHPNCEHLIENLDFSNMDDWQVMCAVMGQPYAIDSADFSYTRRVRAWWTNIDLPSPDELNAQYSQQLDPDACMDPGHTVERYDVDGKETVRTIVEPWRGDPHNPKANTSVPVAVFDEAHPQPQDLHINEAERLMGMEADVTVGSGATVKDRLEAIRVAWNLVISTMIVSLRASSRTFCTTSGISVDLSIASSIASELTFCSFSSQTVTSTS